MVRANPEWDILAHGEDLEEDPLLFGGQEMLTNVELPPSKEQSQSRRRG